MRRECTGASQSILLTCASAPSSSTFEFTFRHPFKRLNTFPPLPAHSKAFSNNIPTHDLNNSQRALFHAFDTMNKDNKPPPFVFGAPQSPPFTFTLSTANQDAVHSHTNTTVLTEQSNNIINKSAKYTQNCQRSILTSSKRDNTRHFIAKTPSSEEEPNIPGTALDHQINEVVFSIASANSFFKETNSIATSHIQSRDDSDLRQAKLATDEEVATNILESNADIVTYTTTTYAGNKRKERDSEDDIYDFNVTKRGRRNCERPQNLLYANNISLTATDRTAASHEKGIKSVSGAQYNTGRYMQKCVY